MLRYDPTKNDHEKYEKVTKRKGRNDDMDTAPAKHMKLNDDNEFQVSKEQFFNVTNQLTSALKPATAGFSLLSMFGRDVDIAETKQKNPYQEITLSKGQQSMLPNSSSMFKDDSSDEEIMEERLNKSQNRPNHAANESKQKNPKKNAKADIWHEPFFIFGNDQRLQGNFKWEYSFRRRKILIFDKSQMDCHCFYRKRRIQLARKTLKLNEKKCEL